MFTRRSPKPAADDAHAHVLAAWQRRRERHLRRGCAAGRRRGDAREATLRRDADRRRSAKQISRPVNQSYLAVNSYLFSMDSTAVARLQPAAFDGISLLRVTNG